MEVKNHINIYKDFVLFWSLKEAKMKTNTTYMCWSDDNIILLILFDIFQTID